ncbi:MAG: hypothetical protein WKF84_27035 [Pyrinomonadaceae bacterium]
MTQQPSVAEDFHSYSNPQQVRVRHVDLDLDVLFEEKTLRGTATLTIERTAPGAPLLLLDTRDLQISRVEISGDGKSYRNTQFALGAPDPILGSRLMIQLPAAATARVRVHYSTSSRASGVQWLEPAQTAGKKHPYVFTQSQAIHARSWIPLQDSPQVRVTYNARVRTPARIACCDERAE